MKMEIDVVLINKKTFVIEDIFLKFLIFGKYIIDIYDKRQMT